MGADVGGVRPFERIDERGEIERGLLVPPDRTGVCTQGIIHLGAELDEPGVRAVRSVHKYTARGPSQVSSDAYRSGWDKAFGSKPN